MYVCVYIYIYIYIYNPPLDKKAHLGGTNVTFNLDGDTITTLIRKAPLGDYLFTINLDGGTINLDGGNEAVL